MTSKTVDADLRIRAKNLSKSTMKELIVDTENLVAAQEKQAKSADLATRSMRELVNQQKQSAALTKELESRKALLQRYIDERTQVDLLAKKLVELAETRKRVAASGAGKDELTAQLATLDKEIVNTQRSMTKFTVSSEKVGAKLETLGVDTKDVAVSMGQITAGLQKANGAYATATSNVTNYAAAVQRANEVQAEAVLRTQAEADALKRRNAATVQDAGRANELAVLKADIQQRDAQAKTLAIQTEAQRRLRQEEELEASTLARNNVAVREAVARLNELAVLKADIVSRSAATVQKQNEENAAAQRSQAILNESNRRREALIRLLNTERGQRILASEAQRKQIVLDEQEVSSKNSVAGATGRAAKQQQYFADSGRKSLSVFQRIRGQLLGLAAAYVGVYQAIHVIGDAIDAVNRNQSLKIGLLTANSGDAVKAADDYKFLRQETERLGIVFDDVAPKYANMLIAAKDVGISAKQTRELFSNVAQSVAAGNLSIDDAEGVFRAVVQVMGKARVQAEELRGQLGDRLPGAVAAFAKANNIALTDLDQHLKKSKGSLDEFLKFMSDYAAKFGPQMEAVTTRLSASIARAKNSYNDWLRTLLDSGRQDQLKGAFDRISEFFKSDEGSKFAENLGKAFGVIVDAAIWLADHIDTVTYALKLLIAVKVTQFALDSANALRGLATQIIAVGTASRAADGSVSGAAVAMSRFKIAATGIAAILLAIAAAIDRQTEAINNGSDDLERYANLLDRIGRRQGVAKAASFEDAAQNVKDIGKELQSTNAQLATYDRLIAQAKGGVVDRARAAVNATFGKEQNDAGIGPLTTLTELEQKRTALIAKAANLRQSENEEIDIQHELLAKSLKLDEDQAAADAAAAKAAKAAADAQAKAAADAQAKAAAAKAAAAAQRAQEAAERLKRAQEAAQDAIAKKTSDINEQIAQTKIETEARTDAQIEANYQATLDKVAERITQLKLDLQALQRQSEAAKVDNSGKIGDAQKQIDVLEAALKAKAEQDRLTAQIELREQHINDLIAERDAKIQLQNTLRETGQQDQLTTQINVNALQDQYNLKIQALVTEFMAFLGALDPNGELYKRLGIDKVILGLQQVQVETAKLTNTQKFFKAWGDEIANAGANMLKAFSDAYAATGSLKEGFQAAKDSFLDFIASFLMQIAQAIIKAIILKAIMNAINGTSGGYGGIISSVLQGMGSGHTGGVVGPRTVGTNRTRSVSPIAFAGAQRFHMGGLPGLKHNEVAAVLKKGEEVVTEDNPRHIANAGDSGMPVAPSVNLKNVNVWDKEEVAQQVWASDANEQLLLNFVSRNATALKQRMGIRT